MLERKTKKIIFFTILIFISFLLFFTVISYWVISERNLPTTKTKRQDIAQRGNIVSSDGYIVSSSKRLYKSVIDKRNLDPDKKDLFIKLYSIYSGESRKSIRKKIDLAKKNQVTLSYSIDFKKSRHLKDLARKLYKLGVFRFYYNEKTNTTFLHGLSIIQSGEKRVYSYADTLTPVVGYVRKYESTKNLTKVKGIKGLEHSFNDFLEASKDGEIKGSKDVVRTIILDKTITKEKRVDGNDLVINLNLKIQKDIEKILDFYNKKFESDEIIISVINSKNSNVLALASSNRFHPNNINKKDYPSLNINAVEYLYEPGSVIKPFVFALFLRYGVTKLEDIIYLHGGKYKIGKKVITDSHPLEWVGTDNVLTRSSNIGMAKLVQKLSALELFHGLKIFGFTKYSGLELTYEKTGSIPSLLRLSSQIYKATISYGYGMKTNFMQILKAYNIFNNDGISTNPTLLKSTKKQNVQVISKDLANTMKRLLIKTVEEGTGRRAKVKGLEIGGKTGTAHIASKGTYQDLYHSSFFGFVNDSNSSYTIGVLVKKIPKNDYYFASKSATVVFKSIIELLVEKKLLIKIAQ